MPSSQPLAARRVACHAEQFATIGLCLIDWKYLVLLHPGGGLEPTRPLGSDGRHDKDTVHFASSPSPAAVPRAVAQVKTRLELVRRLAAAGPAHSLAPTRAHARGTRGSTGRVRQVARWIAWCRN